MATSQSFPAIQGTDHFIIAPSDSDNLEADTTNNPNGYKFAFIHNAGTGASFKLRSSKGKDITVYIPQGAVYPVAVIRVWATGSPASNIVGIIG